MTTATVLYEGRETRTDHARWDGDGLWLPLSELKAISGQEQLPVLMLPGGAAVNGSAAIIAWAKANSPSVVESGGQQ